MRINENQAVAENEFVKCDSYKMQTSENNYGYVYIEGKEEPLDAAENSILLSIIGECALALENQKNAEEKEAAAIFEEMTDNLALAAKISRISIVLSITLTLVSFSRFLCCEGESSLSNISRSTS